MIQTELSEFKIDSLEIFFFKIPRIQPTYGPSDMVKTIWVIWYGSFTGALSKWETEIDIFLGQELCRNQIKIATCGLIDPNFQRVPQKSRLWIKYSFWSELQISVHFRSFQIIWNLQKKHFLKKISENAENSND